MAIAAAFVTWLGALAGWRGWWIVLPLAAVAATASRRRIAWLLVVFVCVGSLSGWLAAERRDAVLAAAVPEGPARLIVDVADDQRRGMPPIVIVEPVAIGEGTGWIPWAGPALTMAVPEGPTPEVGSRLVVEGTIHSRPRTVRGDPVAGTISGARIESATAGNGPFIAIGNLIRSRVRTVVGASSDGRALLSGFMIGDVAHVGSTDLDALRRSGLTHYVAVSGSNVALFLAGLWLLMGPLRIGTRVRSAVGIAGVVVFVIATRWEPSVLRASAMAVLLLGGGALGLPLRPWVALSGAVVILCAVSGQLAGDAGFQLSVVATAGVLVGMRLFVGRRPTWLWGGLGAAVGAQAAVTPLLLVHFGTVPLLSPVANLLAGPLVTAATIIGAMAAVVGSIWLAGVAATIAHAVLALARVAAEWPQLTVTGVAAAAGVASLGRIRRLRPLLAVGLVVFVAFPVVRVHSPPTTPTATFLDIGQGDATLIEDPSGAVMLVDGGREPALLRNELRTRHIRRIDLLVVTHGDLDHVGGLDGITAVVGIGAVWVPDHPDLGPILDRLIADAAAGGIPVSAARPGDGADLGTVLISVIGPRRRYLAQNDGSVVLLIDAERTLLLAGDVEAVAQRELPDLHPDILLVPHHGAGTTDLSWLRRTIGDVVVVSVGENTYGHPTPEVMAVLSESGADVHVTRDEGDVVMPLG